MEVRLFPNSMRPGTGLKPRRESQRPLLPQHARHCPVLEAGSALGFLVYPPLERIESFYVGYQGDGRYQLTYFLNAQAKGEAIFSVALHLPMGSIGVVREQITFMNKEHPVAPETAMALTRTFIVPEDLGTPAGGISLRGATNFQTPSGWDTIYTPVFNMIERPVPPMMVIRVETDWYAHESEFRYVLQPGRGSTARTISRSGRCASSRVKRSRCATARRTSWPRLTSRRMNSSVRRWPRSRRPGMALNTARTISARAARRNHNVC